MFYTYVLQNSVSHRFYIGSTNDLTRRLAEHNRGHTRSTNQKGTWAIVYVEKFITLLEARRRERMIKSYKGGNAFKELLRV